MWELILQAQYIAKWSVEYDTKWLCVKITFSLKGMTHFYFLKAGHNKLDKPFSLNQLRTDEKEHCLQPFYRDGFRELNSLRLIEKSFITSLKTNLQAGSSVHKLPKIGVVGVCCDFQDVHSASFFSLHSRSSTGRYCSLNVRPVHW